MRLLESPSWLRSELARVDVAVLAGGVTLYEAALLGVPSVALAVVPAQMPTIRAFERVGASIAAGCLPSRDRAAAERTRAKAVQAVSALLADEEKRRAMAVQGQQQVDGRGALRVAAALKRLMEQGTAVGWAAQEGAAPQGAERDLMLQSGDAREGGVATRAGAQADRLARGSRHEATVSGERGTPRRKINPLLGRGAG